MNTEEHALDIESHLISDMTKTLRANGISPGVIGPEGFTLLVDELARDAMHQVEKLLVEAEWHDPSRHAMIDDPPPPYPDHPVNPHANAPFEAP